MSYSNPMRGNFNNDVEKEEFLGMPVEHESHETIFIPLIKVL